MSRISGEAALQQPTMVQDRPSLSLEKIRVPKASCQGWEISLIAEVSTRGRQRRYGRATGVLKFGPNIQA